MGIAMYRYDSGSGVKKKLSSVHVCLYNSRLLIIDLVITESLYEVENLSCIQTVFVTKYIYSTWSLDINLFSRRDMKLPNSTHRNRKL